MVPDAKPPLPFVTSHSRRSAAAKLVQSYGPKRIAEFGVGTLVFALVDFETGACRLLPGLCGAAIRILFTALFEQLGDQAGPARLMIGANAGAVVAVKIFVKKNQVPPVRIALEKFQTA